MSEDDESDADPEWLPHEQHERAAPADGRLEPGEWVSLCQTGHWLAAPGRVHHGRRGPLPRQLRRLCRHQGEHETLV